MSEKPNIIFLCTHNRARSQMAEALMKKYAPDHFNIYSAGFEPQEIHPSTIKVMEEIEGIDMSTHKPKRLKDFLGEKHFGIVVTVCKVAEEKCPTIPGVGTRLFWDIEDPVKYEDTDEELDKFRKARDEIDQKIRSFLKEREIKV
ncbi:MAG: Arsenate reductase [Promethearchaeota archaeon]|nr:MAG: Arsenate reductase [Candidatus Lokiarchaeota archaeon]